jgi:hypothetical protein
LSDDDVLNFLLKGADERGSLIELLARHRAILPARDLACHTCGRYWAMVEAQNKVVSIESFRASRTTDRATDALQRGRGGIRPHLSPRSVEHRERMLRFLRMEAAARHEVREETRKDGRDLQGRLLL